MTLGDVARWLMAVSVALSGCASSPEPQFYALFPGRGGPLESPPLEVELRRPGLPGYLDRPQIVRQEQPGKLEFSGAARWGAPLDDMVGSILAQNLAQRLPNARVYTESGTISSSPDAQVEVEIQRFELTEHGTVELVAQVALHWPKKPDADRLQPYTLRRAAGDQTTDQLVRDMSALLAELASSIAQSIHDGPAASPASAAAPGADPGQPASDR